MTRIIALLLMATSLAASPCMLAQGARTPDSGFFNVTITENDKPLLAEAYYHDTDGALVIQGPPLADVIAAAYGLESFQVVGGPEWAHASHLYDIRATPPPAQFANSSETTMLQAMLSDRFQLSVEPARREVTTLALVPAPATDAAVNRAGADIAIDILARRLSLFMGEPVRNLTGHSVLAVIAPGKGLALSPVSAQEAIREQLGLVVEPRTTLMDVLVITAIERPLLTD